MKYRKPIALLLALTFCVTLLAGCNPPPQESLTQGSDNPPPQESITQESGPVYTFTEFLDREGFTVRMGQHELRLKAESYTVNGESLWELVGPGYGCGDTANILFGRGDRYGYEHSWYFDEKNGTESSGYSVYTEELFDNFSLPHGLAFGDSLERVCDKLELSSSPLQSFTPDSTDKPYLMTLREGENTSLTFENLAKNPNVQTTLPYQIIYTESATQTNDAGEDVAVTRKITLFFNEDGNFSRFEFYRGETRYFPPEPYPTDSTESTDSTAE